MGLHNLLRIKPKHLCISGGEPCLVPGIVDIVRQLREGIGEGLNLLINTNGVLRKPLMEVLPYINKVCLSIDGVGEVNRIQRGCDGDRLLDLLEELATRRVSGTRRYDISVVPVVTELSYRRLPELIEKVQGIWKKSSCKVSIEIKPVHPYDHPFSIANKKEVWSDFIKIASQMMNEFEIPVSVRGLEYSSGLDKAGIKITSRCFRQYFAAIVEADGHIEECKPGKYYDYFRERFLKGNLKEKALCMGAAIYNLLINRYCTTCYFPCEHGQFIDEILLAGSETDMAEKIKASGLNVSSDDLHDTCRFIKRHFNKDLALSQ